LIFRYENGAVILLKILFIRMDAKKLVRKLLKKNDGSTPREEQETSEKQEETAEKKKRKADLLGFSEFLLHIADVVRLAVQEHLSHMKIHLKMLNVEIGTDDAAKTALTCAGVISAANVLCALLGHFSNLRFDNENLRIAPDFTSEKSRFAIHLVLTSKPIHIIAVLLRAYFRFFERKDSQNE